MRLRHLILLPVLVFATAFPAGAHANPNQCPAPDSFVDCLPDVRVPLDEVQDAGNGVSTPAYDSNSNGQFDLSGSSASTTAGRFDNDKAFIFDNSNSDGLVYDATSDAQHRANLSPQQVTVVAWVKGKHFFVNRGADAPNRSIVVRGARDCSTYGGAWGLVTGDNGGLQFYVNADPYSGSPVKTPEFSADTIWDDQWHAVAGVFDGGKSGSRRVVSLWVDGRQVSAVDLPKGNTPPDGYLWYPTDAGNDEFTIARGTDYQAQNCQTAPPLKFSGSVDEVRIYGEPLNATQLATLQSSAATSPPDVPYMPDIQGPSLSGTPKASPDPNDPSLGQTLTCHDRDGLTNQTFTWERAPRDTHFENDSNWTPIDNATNSTYTVQNADAGSRVRCHEYGNYTSTSTYGGPWPADRASTSLRADLEAPVNTVPPFITGDATLPKYGPLHINPLARHTLTCNPGTWDNGPEESQGDFTYQWLRNGTAIQGEEATHKTYTLKRRYDFFGNVVDPQGDGDRLISCIVYAKNDVGGTAPVYSSNEVRAIDGRPRVLERPKATLSEPTDGNPLHRHIDCSAGGWRYDYARYGIAPYHYEFQWFRFRGPTAEAISGATDSQYTPRLEDLGRELDCRVTNTNPAGSTITASNKVFIKLPGGPVDSVMYQDGGRNPADPTNLMVMSNEYKRHIDDLVTSRLQAGVATARKACENGSALPAGTKIPAGVPGLYKPKVTHKPVKVGQPPPDNRVDTTYPIRPVDRCRILLHAPGKVWILPSGGVRFDVAGCRKDDEQMDLRSANARDFTCPSLGIEVPSIDPTKPPTLPADIKALESVTPKEIIWDVNDDGVADAICPASAPVLRTIYSPGVWKPRAVIITNGSPQTGHFNFAGSPDDNFKPVGYRGSDPGQIRDDQVKVCATSFDPPPDPDHGPCVTKADFGRVNLTGNLCPVDVRAINADDYTQLLGKFPQVQQLLFQASEDRLKNEGLITARHRRGAGPILWADWGPQPRGAALRKASAADTIATATAEDTAAAASAFGSPYGFQPVAGTPNVDKLANPDQVKKYGDFAKDKASYALDQLMVSKYPIGMNGITQVPQNDAAALMIPSDAHAALEGTKKEMVLAARDATAHLGPPELTDALPLATAGELNQALSDIPKSPDDLLRQANLTDVRNDLQAQIDQAKAELRKKFDEEKQKLLDSLDSQLHKLDHVGPFKLDGEIKIHAQDDGSALIDAGAKFPLIGAKPGDKEGIELRTSIHADRNGNLALRNLHLDLNQDAYLGALRLRGVHLDYNSNIGFNAMGEITFPPAGGVRINKFSIDQNGAFQALDVDYLAGAGQGINVGPGLYLTTLGGGLDLPKDLINAHAVLSIGPSPGGGCPTAGIDGRVLVHFGDPIAFDANAAVSLLCINLAHMMFHADANGLVSLDANAHLDLGPIYADVGLGAKIDFQQWKEGMPLPPWQAYAGGTGGIRGLLSGKVNAVLSSKGVAGCGSITAEVPLIGEFISLFSHEPKKVEITIAGGAGLHFINDIPPLTLPELIANLHLFLGCNIDDYYFPLGKPAGFVKAAAANGSYEFVVPKRLGASAFSIEGAGGAPRIKLRDPKGHLYDFSTAVSKGKMIGHGLWGKVLESADKTAVLVGNPLPGTWTAIPASGSPKIVRVRAARLLVNPSITGHVGGQGLKRKLSYNVTPISGQVVRFVELVKGGQQVIKTLTNGGHGSVHFTPAESTGTHRTIVAEVTQDGLPRENVTVAHYVAGSPTVGLARHIKVKRHGHKAVVTWSKAALGSRYEVIVRYGDGQRLLLIPSGKALRVVAPRVSKREGLRISIVAISPRGHRGPAALAALKGNMEVGKLRHLSPHAQKKHKKRH